MQKNARQGCSDINVFPYLPGWLLANAELYGSTVRIVKVACCQDSQNCSTPGQFSSYYDKKYQEHHNVSLVANNLQGCGGTCAGCTYVPY